MNYDNTNKGALFKNDRKEKDTHPDFKGSVNVGGTEMWISGWRKVSKNGDNFISLSFQNKDEKPAGVKAAPAKVALDDEVPF